METLYPWGYQKSLVTFARLKELARIDLMEPEYADRLFSWINSRGGVIGIGGAHRTVQPVGPTFAPGTKTFHMTQTMGDGTKFFMAVDLVARNGTNIHRAPRWDEVPKQGSGHADIRDYGLHCNVSNESWHIQAMEIDGFDSWVNNGRPRPNSSFAIKGSTPHTHPAPTPPTPTPPTPTAPKPDPGLISPGTRTLRVTSPRMYGIDIAYVQQTLSRQGLSLDDDGYYGPTTAEAVKTMQGWNDLQKSGIIGPATWKAIIAYNDKAPVNEGPIKYPIGSRVLRLKSPTMRGNDVLWVQNVLKKQGLNVSADSIYGKEDVALIKIVQGWNDLTRDGVCGSKTFEVLKRY